MKTLVRDQYLTFNGIKLVQVYSEEFPFDSADYKELWHIPGRIVMTTIDLVDLARFRKVSLNRTTCDGQTIVTTNLV